MKRKAIPLAIFAISIGTGTGMAQQSAQPVFSSAAEAGQSLFQAVQSNSEAAISQILGGSTDLASSHDDGQDKADREVFVQKYQQMHRLHRERDGSVTLYIGAENWPFPIPIVEKNGAWRFDVEAGQQEIRFRRIGENELHGNFGLPRICYRKAQSRGRREFDGIAWLLLPRVDAGQSCGRIRSDRVPGGISVVRRDDIRRHGEGRGV